MKEDNLKVPRRPHLHVSLLILILLSSSLFSLVLGEPKSAALPPGAPLTVEPVAWGGAGTGTTSAPWISTAYRSNMTLSTPAPTGSLILVFAEGGWHTTPSDMQPLDNAGTVYSNRFNNSFHFTGGAFFFLDYYARYQVWAGIAPGPVTQVQVPQTGTNESFLETFAIAYVNASATGTSAYFNVSAGSSHLFGMITTSQNATIAYASWTVRTTLDLACANPGHGSGKDASMNSNYSYILSNTSVSLPPQYGYYDRCDSNLLGMRGFTTGPLNRPAGLNYPNQMHQGYAGAGWFGVMLEVVPSTAPYPSPSPWTNPSGPGAPGFYDWIPPLVFLVAGGTMFGALGLAGYKFVKYLRE